MGWSTHLNTMQFDYGAFVQEFDETVQYSKAHPGVSV